MSPQRDDIADVSYPLHWPIGRPRTDSHDRKRALFRGNAGARQVTLSESRDRVFYELEMMGAVNIVISSNLSSLRREPDDPGCAVYFQLETTGGKLSDQHVLAADRWDRLADNISAIAAHVKAMRGQLRWGVAMDASQAFAGFKALSAVGPSKPWWEVLGFKERPTDPALVKQRYRSLVVQHHPDRGGHVEKFTAIKEAYAAFVNGEAHP